MLRYVLALSMSLSSAITGCGSSAASGVGTTTTETNSETGTGTGGAPSSDAPRAVAAPTPVLPVPKAVPATGGAHAVATSPAGPAVVPADNQTGTPAAQIQAPAQAPVLAAKLTDDNCLDPDLGKVASGTALTLCSGATGTGTYLPPDPPAMPDLTNLTPGNLKQGITVNGVSGTVIPSPDLSLLTASNLRSGTVINGVTGTLVPSPDLSQLTPSHLLQGVTVAGVTGSVVPSPAACSANAQIGCVTNSSFKAADLTALVAANIKAGSTVAGVTGTYPSVSSPLAGSSGVALTSSTFDTRLADAATTFEYFGADGTRYTGGGDANLSAGHIASGAAVFGVVGSYAGPAVSTWDLRYGVTVGNTTGSLQLDCENSSPITQTAEHTCSGSNWVDVTPSGATCATDSAHCMYQDRISGLTWSRSDPGSALTYTNANAYCAGLTFNSLSGWRLPTKEEAEQAFIQRISTVNAGLFPHGPYEHWTVSMGLNGHLGVVLNTGMTGDGGDNSTTWTICVR